MLGLNRNLEVISKPVKNRQSLGIRLLARASAAIAGHPAALEELGEAVLKKGSVVVGEVEASPDVAKGVFTSFLVVLPKSRTQTEGGRPCRHASGAR